MTWKDFVNCLNQLPLINIVALLVSLASLIVAYMSLRLTVLKKGKINFIVYNKIEDINFNRESTHHNIFTSFYMLIPIIVKNIGANPVAIKDIKWKLLIPEFLEGKITSEPEISNTDNLIVLQPYQQKIGQMSLGIYIKNYGTGFDNPIYIKSLETAKEYNGEIKSKIILTYRICHENGLKQIEQDFDITEVIKESTQGRNYKMI